MVSRVPGGRVSSSASNVIRVFLRSPGGSAFLFYFKKGPPRVILFWGSGWPSRSPHSLISDNCCSPPVLPVFSRSNHPQKKRGRRPHMDSLLPERPVSYSTHPLTFLGMSGTGGGGMAWTGSSPSSPVKASLLANLAANSLSAMKLLKEEVRQEGDTGAEETHPNKAGMRTGKKAEGDIFSL